MKKLKRWQFILLIIFYPVGMVYFCVWLYHRNKQAGKAVSITLGALTGGSLLISGIGAAIGSNAPPSEMIIEETTTAIAETTERITKPEKTTAATTTTTVTVTSTTGEETELTIETEPPTETTTKAPETQATTTTAATTTTTVTTTTTPVTTTSAVTTAAAQQSPRSNTVFIAASGDGKRFHIDSNCSGMNGNVIAMERSEAEALGYTPCKKNCCYGH